MAGRLGRALTLSAALNIATQVGALPENGDGEERQDNNVSIEYIANTPGQQTDYPLINTGANEKGEDVAHFSLPITADLFFNINQVVGRYR